MKIIIVNGPNLNLLGEMVLRPCMRLMIGLKTMMFAKISI